MKKKALDIINREMQLAPNETNEEEEEEDSDDLTRDKFNCILGHANSLAIYLTIG